jgi:hypothetical protein
MRAFNAAIIAAVLVYTTAGAGGEEGQDHL